MSSNKHQEYLQQLPSDWEKVTIEQLGTIHSGGTPSRLNEWFWNGLIAWLTPGEITNLNSKWLTKTKEYITELGLSSSSAKLMPKGTIIVTTRATIGTVKIATTPISTNQGFKSIVPNESTDSVFYYYLVDWIKSEIVKLSSGSTFDEISRRDFIKIVVPRPPVKEQQLIAKILDTIDETIAHTSSLIAKLKQIKAGLLHDLLTRGLDENGELRDAIAHPEQFKDSPLGRIPKDWEITTLGSIVARSGRLIQTGPFGSQLHAYEYVDAGVPIIMPQDIQDGYISDDQIAHISLEKARSLARHLVQFNDVVFARRGDLERCVFIVFDFLLRKPENCVVIFDEPELHLHPELSYKLIQTLKSVGTNNQFIFCTHSPDIITASLDHSVIFLSPAKEDNDNQGIIVNENDETNQALKLLGHSVGIIALGKKIVLIEGKESSLDKQVYGSLIREQFPNLVLVPTGGKEEIKSFSTVIERVLSRSIWGVDFYMLCDRDVIPPFSNISDLESQRPDRFRVLRKYHLENYFLDENLWAKIFALMEPDEPWLTSPTAIRDEMRRIASQLVSYPISLTVSSLLRTTVGNVSVMPKNCNSKSKEEVEALLIQNASSEKARIEKILDATNVSAYIQEIYQKLDDSLSKDTDDWKNIIPGKSILSQLCSRASLPVPRGKKLYIKEAKKVPFNPFDEVIQIFADFSKL